MNLYKILFSHHAPKGSGIGIKTFLLAENDEQVYYWLVKGEVIDPDWDEFDRTVIIDGEFFDADDNDIESNYSWYDENDEPELFKTRMLRLKGQIYDDTVCLGNSFYGVTKYGWVLVKSNIGTDFTELIELGVVIKI